MCSGGKWPVAGMHHFREKGVVDVRRSLPFSTDQERILALPGVDYIVKKTPFRSYTTN